MNSKVILIQAEELGRGDNSLGTMLMANFLRLLADSEDKPRSIVFWNKGVTLVREESKVLEQIKKLESQGVEILACTTCLEYFDLIDKLAVGKPTTMVKSIQSMLANEIVPL